MRIGIIERFTWIALLAAAQLWAPDPRIGTWKLISAQSVLDPPRKLTITRQDRGVHVVVSGSPRIEFSANWDGRDYPVQNVPAFNRVAMRRLDRNQAELTERKDGMLVATVRDRISKDRKELTIVTIQAGRANQLNVLRRSGGVNDAANPFVGEWTEDLSKTRLRQGLLLKIEPDGKDGVHFSGEFSYTARFDGKDYLLKDSRNDTVTLAVIDAHTVESTYKRGDQVVERDRWVTSTDGLQMTVTTTGVLAAGESLKEELVFRRQ
jgi:hypothetical protein